MSKFPQVPLLPIKELYDKLITKYGPQGWWPLIRLKHQGQNPTERGRNTWYHPNDFKYPHNDADIFEIMVGAILTQNTSWENADKALGELFTKDLLSPEKILSTSVDVLAAAIRSSGYYNQKAMKLQNLCKFLEKNPISKLKSTKTPSLRKNLLEVKGIGPETADEILLYGFQRPIFVIDAYTIRLLLYMGYYSEKQSYDKVQSWIESQIPQEVKIYNEFHALIVQHCVRICRKRPLCDFCFLEPSCKKRAVHFLSRQKRKNKKTKAKK